jgi:multiple sugar transport system ATP-binding protein
MASISIQRIAKRFADSVVALDGVDLDIAHGELLVLVGPSGSGKSTLLRLIAGLDAPTSGRILIDDDDVTGLPPQRRDLAMVFQSYALYPHMTVRENLAFGLQMRSVGRARIDERVREVARSLGIEELLNRRPAALSGGQRQRVALGRAIVRSPKAFLLDEPLSNLDPVLRIETRAELSLLHRRLGATMVYVTHDQEEAMTLGTRIALMRDGRIEQVAAPMDLYDRPANTFVARFIGSPAMNLWPAALLLGDGATGLVGARPHDIELAPAADGDVTGRVEIIEPLGPTTLVHVQVDRAAGTLARIVVPPSTRIDVGDAVALRPRRDRLHFFDEATGRRTGR